jgi:hypothetical protein
MTGNLLIFLLILLSWCARGAAQGVTSPLRDAPVNGKRRARFRSTRRFGFHGSFLYC